MIKAQLALYDNVKGTRGIASKLSDKFEYNCLLEFPETQDLSDSPWDCRIYLDEPMKPGQECIAEIKFLSPKIVEPAIEIGTKFQIWEMGVIGYGSVLEIWKYD